MQEVHGLLKARHKLPCADPPKPAKNRDHMSEMWPPNAFSIRRERKKSMRNVN
jgi:hypothetical protein